MKSKLGEVDAFHNVYILALLMLMFNVADWHITMAGVEAGVLYEKNSWLEETIVKHRNWIQLLGLKTFICGIIMGGLIFSQKARESVWVKRGLFLGCIIYLMVVSWSLLIFNIGKYL